MEGLKLKSNREAARDNSAGEEFSDNFYRRRHSATPKIERRLSIHLFKDSREMLEGGESAVCGDVGYWQITVT